MSRLAVLLAALAALVAVLGSAGVPGAAQAASGPEYFGTNLLTLNTVAAGQRGFVLSQLGSNGMDLDRIQVDWRDVESSPPLGGARQYSWATTDSSITSLANRGIRAAPLFRYTPYWVRVNDPSKPGGVDVFPPAHYADFAAMVAAFAARYGENGRFWRDNPGLPYRPVLSYEAWNEANLSEYAWNSQADPAAYSSLLKTVQPELKAVQPNAILLGSLAYQETEAPNYVADLKTYGGLSVIDAMGYHPYAPDASTTIGLVKHLRALLSQAGYPNLPIFANEAGQEAVLTNPDGSTTPNRAPATWAYNTFPSDAARAANLSFAGEALALSDCGVEQFLPYSVSGTESDIVSPAEEKLTEPYMGLFRSATGAPTETATALFGAAGRWRARFAPGGPGVPQRLALCSGATSPASALLPITTRYTGSGLGCVAVEAKYYGNPLESATLSLSTDDGRVVASAQTNAFGQASSCMPRGPSQDAFRASLAIPNAGRGGGVACDVANVGCPAGVSLSPSPGVVLSAKQATAPPASQRACKWTSTTRQVQFSPAKGKKLATVRLAAKLRCDTAPRGRAFRFTVRARLKGSRHQTKARIVKLPNRLERRFTLTGRFKSGHRIILTYRQRPDAGIPQLSDTVTLKVAPKRR